MSEFKLPIRIYVEDTDAGGIVYYANYLRYMERARTELMRTFGYDKPALFDGMQLVVHEVQLKYHKPAVLDDQIVASARLIKVGRASFLLHQAVTRGDELLVEGQVKAACIDYQNKKPAPLPKAMYQVLKEHCDKLTTENN